MAYLFEVDPSARLDAAPVIAGAGLGIAIFTTGRTLLTSGDFSSSATTVNYLHQNTPPSLTFSTCTNEFLISAHHPRYGFDSQQFWFRISFEYNGHDLRNVAINALVDKSSSMTMSKFTIEFNGQAHSVPADPVAEVVFQISGR